MTWAKVDDQLAFHPKALAAGNEALGMWVRAMSYSCQMLTGGFISRDVVIAFGGVKVAKRLVAARLWHEVEGGYQFHDWDEYQPSAEVEKVKRERTRVARSEAGRLGAEARWHGKTDSESMANRMAKPMANGMANEWQNDAPEPEPDIYNSSLIPTTTKQTPIPADWEVSEAGILFAQSRAPSMVIADEVQRFRDYNLAKGRKLIDWDAAWRTWVMQAVKYTPEIARPLPPPKKQFGAEYV